MNKLHTFAQPIRCSNTVPVSEHMLKNMSCTVGPACRTMLLGFRVSQCIFHLEVLVVGDLVIAVGM
jgi:hypothetical protein